MQSGRLELAASRVVGIDCLKGIAIIGVVLAHLEYPTRLSLDCMGYVHVFQNLLGWCVMAFFFCSGLLAKAPPQSVNEFTTWCVKRARRLLLPCLAFSLVYKTTLLLIGQTHFFQWHSPVPMGIGGWLSFLLIPEGPQFYFLPFLFVISLLCFFVMALIRSVWCLWGIVTAFHVFSGFWFSFPTHPYGPDSALLIAYTYAYIVGLLTTTAIGQKDLSVAVIMINLFLGVTAAILWRTDFFLFPIVPLILLRFFTTTRKLIMISRLHKLGEYSAAIYVWHAPLFLPFCSIVLHRLLAERFELLQVILTLATTIVLSCLLGQIIRHSPWLQVFQF